MSNILQVNKIEEALRHIGKAFSAGSFKSSGHVVETLAYAECIFDYLPVKLQLTTIFVKDQLAKAAPDGLKLFQDYIDRLKHDSLFSHHDAMDLWLIYDQRIALESYIDYYPLSDFSSALAMDNMFFELISSNKRAAQECLNRYKKGQVIKSGHKRFWPIQHQRVHDKCAAIIAFET